MAMDRSMERWYEATKVRCSVRKYLGKPSDKDMDTLEACAELLRAHGVRIELIEAEEIFTPLFLWYGRIKGASTGAVLIHTTDAALEYIGYIGEAFALECTTLGLGTCWLGGSFSKSKVEEHITLGENEKVSCVIAFGIPNEQYVSRSRKSIEKITNLDKVSFDALPDWQKLALNCARRAPSAINRQPWHFDVAENSITVSSTLSNSDKSRLDCGIAMLHIELGAAHGGVYGEWHNTDEGSTFEPAPGVAQ